MELFLMMAQYANGNPGASTFLLQLIQTENIVHSLPIITKMEQIPSLRGTNLYVLWSDLCNKDIEQVSKLCKNCPNNILEDACSRQDYSGRELVAPFM